MFILFQGKVQPILDKLGEQFAGLAGSHGALQPEDELYTLFDLDLHWQIFFALCTAKMKQAELDLQAPSRPVSAPSAPQRLTLSEPDSSLFSLAVSKRPLRRRMSVLLVEDDPFTRRLVVNALKADFDVWEAEDAAHAYQMYGTHAPDAVLLDIELPDSNGHVVLSKLLRLDREAFVVMLSANSVKENILAALEKGAQGFITKPFAKEKLMHYMRQCVSFRQRRPQMSGA